ncbi:hypothetical protein COW81_02075 [Candidatus Campbellbacteria bacterium CG22_combo_CG10-13_8_21_14_all_36_13]|uniref:Type II toxin-antitoxin system mRNA interferase toxin, RelE/StbE family n=1 Tax=Candidatus Campbellbacteria bacterium CG22_combo_CG10-13_8_21_14_all_36_13 TaxID=1974529 RepID=A0A2H0DY47_9BACT|nr:MAG: hypothetical protein COW81_02075 [Candidatus Campbellbacteria bacterium CG22_combo_CG10-13_8_21_14_all_36_13]
MEVSYLPQFIKMFNSLPKELQDEALEKIILFKNKINHKQLKVHKLNGPLKDRHSFSVNYKTRIVFKYISKKEAVLLAIGNHNVYKN